MQKILFNKDEYEQLDPVIKTHYNVRLLLLLLSLVIPVYFVFGLHLYKAAIAIFAGLILGMFYILYEINLFCKQKIKMLTGVCVKIVQQNLVENVEKKLMKTNVLFGKCTIYLQADGKTYEILTPYKKIFAENVILNVWYNNNTFTRANGMEVIHAPLLVSYSPENAEN